MSANIENNVNILIDEIAKEIANIKVSSKNYDVTTREICSYVSSKVAAQCKGLMSTLYTELSSETLKGEIFKDNANKNKFYDLDLRSHIYEKYNFEPANKINFKAANSQLVALGIPVGVFGIGVALTLSLSNIIVIPVALVVAVLLYPVIKKGLDSFNKQQYYATVQKYMNGLKIELLSWFDSIQTYYLKQVDELIKTL
ncbi:hypothetical protein [Paenibacillus qinlingensis]|uniref:hypothetical protein n=1 Tax=Paenibacillus qinlingensis TaxID=1837343 RepID=UPI001565EF65|nr:hypothetical protein [Paenibacillus qinlingensis]NQX62594.1 hypothetical protein [Paenibacillus qinlingensis]